MDLGKVLPPKLALDSVSIQPLLDDPDLVNGPRRFAYAEVFRPNGPGPYERNHRAIRDQRWKLIRGFRSDRDPDTRDEFYDLDLAPPGLDGEDMCPCPENLDVEALAAYERLAKALEEIGGP